MSRVINSIVRSVCFLLLFQVVANSQSVTASSRDRFTKTSNSPSSKLSTNTEYSNRPDAGADSSVNKAIHDVKTEKRDITLIAEPRVKLKNPSIELNVTAQASKMDLRPFDGPTLKILGEAKEFRATAYSLRGLTRSGIYVRPGVIAADPRVLPLGSVVQIRAGNYSGVYTVHDTGKKIKGNIVDLWIPSTREARQFGRRLIKVHILRLGPINSINTR